MGFGMAACGDSSSGDPTSPPPSDNRPELTGTVTIDNMSPIVDDIITATYSGGNGSGEATWTLLRDDAIAGSDTNNQSFISYTVTGDDLGCALKIQVSFANQKGSVTSSATDPVIDDLRETLTGTVTIDNIAPKADDVLTASYGSGNGTGGETWQWLRGNTEIPSTDNYIYTVTSYDVGYALTARVRFADQKGFIDSDPTASVYYDGRPLLTGVVTINNASPKVGDYISASYSSGNGWGTGTWQWLRDGEAVKDESFYSYSPANYTVSADDLGKTLTAQVSFTNYLGNVSSEPTDAAAAMTYTISQVGGVADTTDTTGIAFSFGASINSLGITVDDIILDGAATKTTETEFTGSGAYWTLSPITVNSEGSATITVIKTGIEEESKGVTVFKYNPYWNITWHLDDGEWEDDEEPPSQILKNTVLTRPTDPIKDLFIFDDWYANPGLSTVYTFTSPVTTHLDLYAKWKSCPAYVDNDDSEETMAFDDLKTALDSITAAGNYTVRITENQTLAPYTIAGAGKDITLKAQGGPIEVSLVGTNGSLFQIGSGVSLTLGSDITLNIVSYLYADGIVSIPEDGYFTMIGGTIRTTGNPSPSPHGVYVGKGTFTMKGGTITEISRSRGVYVDDADGTFIMEGGTISENRNNGVRVVAGTFIMKGGTISNNETSDNPGAGVYNSGTFIMKGGTIELNKKGANGDGGGVYNDGTFIMKGGTIRSNSMGDNSHGGGVYNAGTFDMEGGTISNNTSGLRGGGVFSTSGSFTMIDGSITDNKITTKTTGSNYGAGVCIWGGTFDMEGGTIGNNSTRSQFVYGGGVYVTGIFTMKGGTISGNIADGWVFGGGGSGYGGGVFLSSISNTTFNMEGGTITGNNAGLQDSNGSGVSVSNGSTFIMTGGTISKNVVFISDTGNFRKEPPASGTESGTIYGNDEGTAYAVYHNSSPSKIKRGTAGPTHHMDSAQSGPAGGWD